MAIYLILLLAVVLNLLLTRRSQKRSNFIIILFLLLMVGLRTESVGTDTWRYFLYVDDATIDARFGPLYSVLRFFCSRIGESPNIFLVLLSALTYLPLLWFINKRSNNPAISIFVFMVASTGFFLETFNLVREMLSVVMCLLVTYFYETRQFKYMVLFMVIAFLAHPYSIFFFPFLLIDKINLSFGKVVLGVTISAVVGISGLLDIIMGVLQSFLAMVSNDESLLYQVAKYGERDIASEWNIVGKLSHILPTSIMVVISYCNENSRSIYYKLFFVGAIILNLFIATVYCERISAFFTIAEIIAVPCALCGHYSFKYMRQLLVAFLCITTMYYVYTLNTLRNVQVHNTPVPYESILN